MTVAFAAEVDAEGWRAGFNAGFAKTFAMQPRTEDRNGSAQQHEKRSDHIREKAHVGIAVMGENVDGEEKDERENAARGNDEPNQADPIVKCARTIPCSRFHWILSVAAW